jgi:hypothetical protein
MTRSFAGAAVLAAVLLAACGDSPTSGIARDGANGLGTPPRAQRAYGTSLQAKVARWVADRQAQGLLAPTVFFEFSSGQGSSVAELQSRWYAPGQGYSYTARTVMHYDGPAQAGLERWPDFTLSDEDAQTLGVSGAELMSRYVAAREAARPGFWDRYELGHEPRTYTVTESGTGTSPDLSQTPRQAPAAASTSDELVLGFSLGVSLFPDKSWTFGLEDVEEVTFSIHAGAGIGLRLPLAAALEAPDPMDEGSSYSASSTVHGVDWSAAQYAAAGVVAQDGKEAFAYIQAQACVELSGVYDRDEECAGPDTSLTTDFATPLGSGASFPLPTLSYPLVSFGVAGVDLDVTPSIGSDKITADWSVSGEAQGGGDLTYTSSASPITLQPVLAVDGPATAHYAVNDFRYYFNQFAITLGASLWVSVPIPLAPDWEESWSRDFVTLDLSFLIGALDLSVGTHAGSSPTGLGMDVAILNVAPTADLSLAGGQVVVINGVPTVMGDVGEDFTFTGTSHDPGRDDLTVSWDWGDGAPAPDETTVYPVPGATGPNDVADLQVHAFGRACMYDVTFQSVDDDDAAAEDDALLMITASGNPAWLEGFWQRQLARNGNSVLAEDVVNCYLAMVGHVSGVFSEARDASTIPAAFAVVNLPHNHGSEVEQLDRELLVAWLNFASGAMGYFQLVDTDEDGVPDTPMNEVMQAAEAVRLDGSSTPATLRVTTEMLHKISEQFTKGFGS